MSRHIPKALREACWLKLFGKVFETKCYIVWCPNTINVFNFECGHDNPHSKGGVTALDNLFPICSRCNKSMSDSYTIEEWNKLGESVSAVSIQTKLNGEKRKLNMVDSSGKKKKQKVCDTPEKEEKEKSKLTKCIIM